MLISTQTAPSSKTYSIRGQQFEVEARGQRNAVKVPLAAHGMAILRQT